MALQYNPQHGVLDFSGVTNALGNYTKGVNQNMRREQWNALAGNVPGVSPEMMPYLRQAGPDQGPALAFGLAKDAANRDLQERQFNMQSAYRDALTDNIRARTRMLQQGPVNAMAAPPQEPAEPQPIGMREDGSLIYGAPQPQPTTTRRVLGESATAGATSSTGTLPAPGGASVDFGPTGQRSDQVPGIVGNPNSRGGFAANRYATEHADRQRALADRSAAATPEDQQRLAKLRQTQRYWTEIWGKKPTAGHIYREDGTEESLKDRQSKFSRKDEEKERMDRVVGLGLKDLNAAEKTLTGSSNLWRSFNMATDRGEIGQAAADFNQAALDIVYAKSGKQTAVAEMNMFLKTYGPKPGDSADRIRMKAQRVRDRLRVVIGDKAYGELEGGATPAQPKPSDRLQPTQRPAQASTAQPQKPAGDGWVTLPGGIRYREKVQ